MILTILVTAIGVSICTRLVKLGLLYLHSYRMLLRSKCFRGPRSLPLIGNAHLFVGYEADFNNRLHELTIEHPSPFRLWLGPQLYFIISEPEQIKMILLDPNALEKNAVYDMIKPVVGNGLITAPVSTWKPHRKAIELLFSRSVLASYVQIMKTTASKMVEKMGKEVGKTEFNVHHYTSRYTFDSICLTSVGSNVDASILENRTIFNMAESTLGIIPTRVAQPWLQPDFIFKRTSVGQTFFKGAQYIHDFTMKNLVSKQSEIQKHVKMQSWKSLMTLLLTSTEGNYKFTDEEIVDEVITIIGAGYETTSNLLSHAIFMLANYPSIQDEVYAEVHNMYGESNPENMDITLNDIQRMEHLDRFLKETLRFFPGVPLLGRYLSKEINIGEDTLPAGSSVMVHLIRNHRNEKYWPRPLEFIPDRFLPNHPLGARHAYAYIPFSIGPRNCIGLKYGMISAKVFLITLISRYIIKTRIRQEAADLELKTGITLKAKYPIMVSIERRFPQGS